MRKPVTIAVRTGLVLIAAAALVLVWIEFSLASPGSLPNPTGPYQVGRIEFDWVDNSRPDPLAPFAGQNRELDALIWYPTEKPGKKHAVYIRDNWLRSLKLPFPTPEYKRVRTHAWPDAAIATPRPPGWPVVILSSGFGARPVDYSSLAEEFASRGYVVAAHANTYSGTTVVFPDGRIATARQSIPDLDLLVRIWAGDIGSVVEKLAALNGDSASVLYKKLDTRRVGIIGHSFGGAASAQFCLTSEKCSAGIDMDGALHGDPVKKGIPTPFLFMLSDAAPPLSIRLKSETRSAWQTAHREFVAQDRLTCSLSPNCYVEIEPGFRHMNFTDSAVLFRPPLSWAHPMLGTIRGSDGLDLIRKRIVEFLDRWINR